MKDFIPKIVAQDRITRCVLRNELPVTAELAAEVAASTADYVGKAGKPMARVAEVLGMSAETLAEVVAGPYQAAHEATIRALDRWLEIELQRPVAGRFCKTNTAVKVMAAGRLAIQTGGMVLVTGPAGIGKTLAAQALAAETPGSIFDTVHAAGCTSMAVLESLSLAMGRPVTYRTTASRLYASVEAAVRGTCPLLVLDEVHRLASRRNDSALHLLRDLHDGAAIPMLLLGMPAIKQYIQAGRSEGEALDQLASRITLFLDLEEDAESNDGGRKLATVEDIRKMLAGRRIRLTPDGERFLAMLANEAGAGAFRAVAALLDFAERFATGGGPVDADTLRAIQSRRLGVSASAALESRMTARAARAVGA
jgi:DNA transposition AAA+ family ATPase